jgi:DNA-directed RNA polymerase subunit L
MISDEDIEELSAALDPNSSAAVLVFEHTWVRPLRDAIVESGGVLAENFRVPPEVVAEVMAALETAS